MQTPQPIRSCPKMSSKIRTLTKNSHSGRSVACAIATNWPEHAIVMNAKSVFWRTTIIAFSSITASAKRTDHCCTYTCCSLCSSHYLLCWSSKLSCDPPSIMAYSWYFPSWWCSSPSSAPSSSSTTTWCSKAWQRGSSLRKGWLETRMESKSHTEKD